ncbi:tRNA pseudouridine synthase-like 1 isoform X2 [Nycticebus coucang]|uniref:tRNA pseudouridine synthase-like 1 isoform X2 n=1 Tax=Nycticebus coucang TaxID=9470 RepID=UPI00234D1101|nr:tRNA pseudouridine synthase-like 1 isoform X2 [Nycticebus coucang]
MGPGPAAGSVRARYLVYFQYLGADFNGVAAVRGAQRAVGVLNYLEEAAEQLNSVVPVKFTISSRTDTGVHALCNTAHLDIQRRSGRPPFPPEVLAQALNTHLKHPAIRVLQAFRVPSDFHARYAATSRTYLYRLATGCPQPKQLPVFERSLCWALRSDYLDVDAMREAAQYLLGTHDFSAFQSAGSPATSSVRTLHRVSVSLGPASPYVLPQESRWQLLIPRNCPVHDQPKGKRNFCMTSSDSAGRAPSSGLGLCRRAGCAPPAPRLRASLRRLRFWNLEFESQSFLYKQVRRMTAVLVAVGLGVLLPAQVKMILESRDPLGKHQAHVAPAHGLFLKSVLYGSLGDPGPSSCILPGLQCENYRESGLSAEVTPVTAL